VTINPEPRPAGIHPWGEAPTPYEELGGEQPLRRLVDHFYDRIRRDSPLLREMHPADDRNSRRNLFEFLSGWMGGPDLYTERKGHPRLRMRHLAFSIGPKEAEEWMRCMRGALADTGVVDPLLGYLDRQFERTTRHVRNADTSSLDQPDP